MPATLRDKIPIQPQLHCPPAFLGINCWFVGSQVGATGSAAEDKSGTSTGAPDAACHTDREKGSFLHQTGYQDQDLGTRATTSFGYYGCSKYLDTAISVPGDRAITIGRQDDDKGSSHGEGQDFYEDAFE